MGKTSSGRGVGAPAAEGRDDVARSSLDELFPSPRCDVPSKKPTM